MPPAGLWRPVQLRYLPEERFEHAVVETQELTSDLTKARLRCHYRARLAGRTSDRYEVRVLGRCGDSAFEAIAIYGLVGVFLSAPTGLCYGLMGLSFVVLLVNTVVLRSRAA